MARLCQRRAEIEQSLGLIARAGAIMVPEMPRSGGDGHGMATVETPRGPATLHLTLKDGAVASAHLTTIRRARCVCAGPCGATGTRRRTDRDRIARPRSLKRRPMSPMSIVAILLAFTVGCYALAVLERRSVRGCPSLTRPATSALAPGGRPQTSCGGTVRRMADRGSLPHPKWQRAGNRK